MMDGHWKGAVSAKFVLLIEKLSPFAKFSLCGSLLPGFSVVNSVNMLEFEGIEVQLPQWG